MDRDALVAIVAFVALFVSAVCGVMYLSAASRASSDAAASGGGVAVARRGARRGVEDDADGGAGDVVVGGRRNGARGGVRGGAGAGVRRRRGRGGDEAVGEGRERDGGGGAEAERARGNEARDVEDEARLMGMSRKEQKAEAYRRKWEEREAKEREELERAKAERAECEIRESEEYGHWKESIGVEESGTTKDSIEREWQSIRVHFIEYIKEKKVVVLEELAAHFGLKTAYAVRRVKTLESEGHITGVFDDRGKFIYVSREEMKQVADFIVTQGRVSIAQLAQKSNELVKISM